MPTNPPYPSGKLACDPDFEASIYEASTEPASNINTEVERLDMPVVLLRSRNQAVPGVVDMNTSATDPTLAGRLRRGVDLKVDYGHFIPMEAPDLVASEIRKLL